MDILSAINEQIKVKSGLDLHREYLGISKIAGCPRAAILEYRNGISPNEQSYRMSFAGYEQEHSVFSLLIAAGIANPESSGLEVVAGFDKRLRGHIDGLTLSDELLEIKSVTVEKFRQIVSHNMPVRAHDIQSQLYMFFGGWKLGYLIYRCRETYEHKTFVIELDLDYVHSFQDRAIKILHAIDAGELIPCECGRCRE